MEVYMSTCPQSNLDLPSTQQVQVSNTMYEKPVILPTHTQVRFKHFKDVYKIH